MTDSIADMLTRIRNSFMVSQKEVFVPMSKIKLAIARILETEGYVENVSIKKGESSGDVKERFERIKIRLKYNNGESKIRCIKRVSRSGLKQYSTSKNLPWVLNGKGIAIVSTSDGVMTNREARKKKIGGEVLCQIY